MTPGDLSSLFPEYQYDEDMLDFCGTQFTLGPELTNAPVQNPVQPARGPRRGKKPLRPRQQQLHSLEAELEQKLRDLKAAEAERERLQQRIKVLELVLPMREHYAQLLKQQRQAAHVWPTAHACTQEAVLRVDAPRIAELKAAASSGGLYLSSGSESDQASDDALEPGAQPSFTADAGPWQRRAALTHVTQRAADQTQIEDVFTSGQIALFTSLPAHNRVPCHVLRHVSGLWKQWMREAGLILHAYDARPHDPGPQLKLAQLYEQLAQTVCARRMEHPFLLTELQCINFETDERAEPPPDSYWIPVAQGLRLSPEQATDAKAALALYNERAARALEERRQLAAQLSSHMAVLQGAAPPHGQHGAAQQASADGKVGQLALQVDELAGRLYRNVMGQGSALEVMKDFMGTGIFSLAQMIRASVLSYPYFPDVVAILSSIDATSPCAGASRPETACRLTRLHELPALQLLR